MYKSDAETDEGIAQAIIQSVIDFEREPWPKVSDNAKDLVRCMLDPNPYTRLTAQQVLGLLFFLFISIQIISPALYNNLDCYYLSIRDETLTFSNLLSYTIDWFSNFSKYY